MEGRSTTYNKVVTEEKWENVNECNKTLIDDFVEYLDSSNKSDETIKQYKAQLRILMVYLYDECKNKFFIDLKKVDLVRFAGWLQNKMEASPNRIASFKAVISSLSNYICDILDEEYPDFKNISSVIKIPSKEAVREKTILSEDDIMTCLDKLVEAKKYQVACFMALLFASGMRKSEAIQMLVSDFDEDKKVMNGMFYLTHKIRTKGKGKQGKQLQKYVMCEIFDPYLKLWLDYRKEQGIISPYLFVRYRDGEYKCAIVPTANSFANSITEALGVPGYCHNFRHAWCSYCHRKGYPESVIQKLQGWADLSMVSLYNDMSDEEQLNDFFVKNNTEETL